MSHSVGLLQEQNTAWHHSEAPQSPPLCASTLTLTHTLVYSVHFCSEIFQQLVRAAAWPCLGAWVWSKCGQQCLTYLSCRGVRAGWAMTPVAPRASSHGSDSSWQAWVGFVPALPDTASFCSINGSLNVVVDGWKKKHNLVQRREVIYYC